MDFAIPSESKRKQKDTQTLGPPKRTKIAVEHEGDGDIGYNWCTWNTPQWFGKRSGRSGNRKKNQKCLNYSLLEINQNTELSPGNLRRLAVTQTTEKDHQLNLVWKTCKEENHNNDKLYMNKYEWPSHLGLENIPNASLLRGKSPPLRVS